MNEPVDMVDLELRELHDAVTQVQSLMAEGWFRELAMAEVCDHIEKLSDLLEQIGLV